MSACRPPWVGVAARHAPSPGPLLTASPVAARAIRQLGARGLHRVLRDALAEAAAAGIASAQAASGAVECLLPGRPKSVAALTRAGEVVELLLTTLAAGGTRPSGARGAEALGGSVWRDAADALAGEVLFSLALTGALRTEVVLESRKRRLVHRATLRGLEVDETQRIALGPAGLHLDGRALDPWSPPLSRPGELRRVGSLVVSGPGHARLPVEDALSVLAARDALQEDVTVTLDGVAVFDPDADADSDTERASLPLAFGVATVRMTDDPEALARALLDASARHKLAILRLTDPLVHDEADLDGLIAALAPWIDARLGSEGERAEAPLRPGAPALTPLGRGVSEELRAPVRSPRSGAAHQPEQP